ncbi:MAG: hypothetical protein Q8900_08160 [Bacillota bacterium]|nr:hypothetical protein [Bacillota bacterium]
MDFLDKKAREKIGFNYVIEKVLVSSIFGREMLKGLVPIKNKADFLKEYENIEKFIAIAENKRIYYKITNVLQKFKDIRNTFKRIKREEFLDEVEIYEIKTWVILYEELKKIYDEAKINIEEFVFCDFSEILKLLNPKGTSTSSFYIYDDYSKELKIIRASKRAIEKRIDNESLNISELLEKRRLIVNDEKEEEVSILNGISISLRCFADELLQSAALIGKIDIVLAKAKMAIDFKLCKPIVSNENVIIMENGVNPLVKELVEAKGCMFYPVTIKVSEGTSVITGANMGGKTVSLTIIALNYLLAVMGFYTFAEKFEFCPMEFISFLYEDGESLQNGLSTFGGEVIQLKKILSKIKSKSGLIILDEFARGTNPEEGSRIIKALTDYLNKFSSISILSTHYDGAASYAKCHYQIRGLKDADINELKSAEFEEKNFIKLINSLMDYTLEKVDKNEEVPKDAVKICSILGLDDEIIEGVISWKVN